MNQKYVSFTEAFKLFWHNYFNFTEKSSRSEYWWWILCQLLILFGLNICTLIIPFLAIVKGLFGLAVIIPDLALTFRRFNDVGIPKVFTGVLLGLDLLNLVFIRIAGASALFGAFNGGAGTMTSIHTALILLVIEIVIGIIIFVISLLPGEKPKQTSDIYE